MTVTDEVYGLLKKWLNYGDQTGIAKELGVDRQTVCNVLNGQGSSQRIIKAALRRAVKNKEITEQNIKRLRQ